MQKMDENDVFYELGFIFSNPKHFFFSSLMNRLLSVLVIVSLILQFGFKITQIFTLLLLALLILNGNFKEFSLISRSQMLLFVFFLTMVSSVEQYFSGIRFPLTQNPFTQIPFEILLLDVIWVSVLAYFVFLFYLSTKGDSDTFSMVPQTEKAQKLYEGFIDRLKFTEFDIARQNINIERNVLISFYLRIVALTISMAILITFGTLLFWRMYLGFSDNVTIQEEYDLAIFTFLSFISLVSVILLTLSFSDE